MKLNIGCGKKPIDGWVNLDKFAGDGVTATVDLDKERLADYFGENSVIEVFSSHTLEHLEHPERVIEDLLIIMKSWGRINLVLPHWTSSRNYSIYHQNFFSSTFLREFEVGRGSDSLQVIDTGLLFVDKELRWFKNPSHRILKTLNKVMNTIMNINHITQYLFENHLWVFIGGIGEFRITYEVHKK